MTISDLVKSVNDLDLIIAFLLGFWKAFNKVSHSQPEALYVFEHLPGPNRTWQLGVYAVMFDPLLSLYGIVTWFVSDIAVFELKRDVKFQPTNHVTWYTTLLPEPTGVRFW